MKSTNQNGVGTSGEHEQEPGAGPHKGRVAPHWNAILGLFILPFVIAVLTRRSVSPVTLRVGSLILLGIVTFVLAIGIGRMIVTLPGELKGLGLLYSGLLLYACNVLMFALWYWEIDGGGPEQRRRSEQQAADFLFPQQMGGYDGNWVPHFFDYLYVGFTGATAFSPTDTMPLSHRAKFLMMVEAVLALILLSFVVSRAINII